MKTTRTLTLMVLSALLITLTGCSTIRENPRTAKGAGIGAATGAAAGALLAGEAGEGAIIGGLAGALLGGAVGHYTADKEKDAQSTAREYGYDPAQGRKIEIESVSTSPGNVQPGETIQLQSQYAILTPNTGAPVAVTESYMITHDGEVVGTPEVTVAHEAGTYKSSIPLRLPETAEEGTYRIQTTIEAQGASDTREALFVVR